MFGWEVDVKGLGLGGLFGEGGLVVGGLGGAPWVGDLDVPCARQ